MPRMSSLARFAVCAAVVHFAAGATAARAQDSADERRCTGAIARRVRRANQRLHGADRFGPLSGANLAILHHDRGMALRAKGDLAGALKDFEEAIKLDPNYARGFADRGSARFAQHDFDGAIADLDEAIRLDAGRCRSRS